MSRVSKLLMADLANIVKFDYNGNNEQFFFETIPVWKIVLLSTITFGFYSLIWFYKMWKTLRLKFGYELNSVIMTLFMPITIFWLFAILEKYIKAFDKRCISSIILAFSYLFLLFLLILPDLYSFLSFFSVAIITLFQHKINEINKNNFENAKYNGWSLANCFWTLVFMILFIKFVKFQKIQP